MTRKIRLRVIMFLPTRYHLMDREAKDQDVVVMQTEIAQKKRW